MACISQQCVLDSWDTSTFGIYNLNYLISALMKIGINISEFLSSDVNNVG